MSSFVPTKNKDADGNSVDIKEICNEEKNDDPCHADINKKNVKDTCDEIKEKKNAYIEAFKVAGDIASSMNPFKWLNNLTESNQKIDQKIETHIRSVQNDIKESDTGNKCFNQTKEDMTNIIDNTPCTQMYLDAGRIPPLMTYSNITQENKDQAQSKCQMQAFSDAISSLGVSIDNAALLDAVQSLGGSGNQEVDQKSCTDIDVNQTSCSYIKQRNCCVNQVDNHLVNKLTVCGNVDGATQRNASINVSLCAGEITNKTATDLDVDVKNKGGMSASQMAVGTLIALAMLGVIGAAVAGFVKYMNRPCKGKKGEDLKVCMKAHNEKVKIKANKSMEQSKLLASTVDKGMDVAAKQGARRQPTPHQHGYGVGHFTYAQKLWRRYKMLFILAGALFVIHITKKK